MTVSELRTTRLGPWVRGAMMGVALAIFAQSLSVGVGALAAAAGAVLGAVVSVRALERWRLRPWASAALAVGLGAACWGLAWLLASVAVFTDAVGPGAALRTVEALRWFGFGLAVSGGLRTAARTAWWGRLVEAAVIVSALASTLASHRDGMIARPLEISDWFWSRGVDPVVAFMAMGGVCAALVASLWLQRRSVGASLGALFAFVLLCLGVGAWLHQQPLPASPHAKGGAGSEKGSAEGQEGAPQEGSPERPPEEPPPPQKEEGERIPVAVVILHRDAEPWGGYFYFRSATFSHFNGTRLVEATRSDVDQDAPRAFPIDAPIEFEPAPPHATRVDVAADIALLTEHRRPFAPIDPLRLEPRPNPSPARFVRAYHAVSRVLEGPTEELFGHAPGDPAWGADVWHHYTALPGDPRYLELATRLTSRIRPEFRDDPFAQALVFKAHLEETATYSFKKNYRGSDPTAAFLFSEDKIGYCVHLAHSMAMLLRAVGVPARVSAGYAVDGSQKGRGSSLLVTNADAHAWAEVYLSEVGWVPIEVVPEKTDVEPTPFEAEDLQQLLGEMARQEGRTERVQASPFDWAALRRWLAYAPWLFVGVWAGLYGIRWIRRLRPRWTRDPRKRTRWAYLALLDELAASGVVRRTGESREKFARRLAGQGVPSLERLTEGYLLQALGPPDGAVSGARVGPQGLRLWQDGMAEVHRRLPWWRRLLAWLHPVPFWSVR